MSNKETLQEYNTMLEENNVSLANVLETIENLPSSSNQSDVYSTEEMVIGTWIDGKPLYRKVIEFPNGVETSTALNRYNLSQFGITNVEEIYISKPSFYTLNGFSYPFSYYDGNKYITYVSNTILSVQLGYENIAKSRCVITLEYTKTTD